MSPTDAARPFIGTFRQAIPYINAHRGRIFVIHFEGEMVESPGFRDFIHDVALLKSLGVRLVLVHGARPQVEATLQAANHQPTFVGDIRVTDEAALAAVKEAVGSTRVKIEARLSQGLRQSPMHGARIRVASGNVVVARPVGVRDGVDFHFTGEVRRIDTEAITGWLDTGSLVLLSPLGYSATGEVFNVHAHEVAAAAARALGAEKLISLMESEGPQSDDGQLIRQMRPDDVDRWLTHQPESPLARHLSHAADICQHGVRRVHLIPRHIEGGLLIELFTRDGVGTLVSSDRYEQARSATIADVAGLLALLRPLEADGTLVRRSRELLENEIERFVVLTRDRSVIGCAALYAFPDEAIGELACVAVHQDYRGGGRADTLLDEVEVRAREAGLERLFVLTTRTAHWFQERGFEPGDLDTLPVQKRQMYNLKRNSKVFVKTLS